MQEMYVSLGNKVDGSNLQYVSMCTYTLCLCVCVCVCVSVCGERYMVTESRHLRDMTEPWLTGLECKREDGR